jgi:hypothetical protein
MKCTVQEAKSPVKTTCPYIFLALLGAPYMYDISRLRVNEHVEHKSLKLV